jgi:hypothetical protein
VAARSADESCRAAAALAVGWARQRHAACLEAEDHAATAFANSADAFVAHAAAAACTVRAAAHRRRW